MQWDLPLSHIDWPIYHHAALISRQQLSWGGELVWKSDISRLIRLSSDTLKRLAMPDR